MEWGWCTALTTPPAAVVSFAVSADLIAVSLRPAGTTVGDEVRVWALDTFAERGYIDLPFLLRDMVFAPDGAWLAGKMVSNVSVWSRVWDTASFTQREGPVIDESGIAIGFHGGSLVVITAGGTVKFTDPATGRVEREITVGAQVTALAFAPDGAILAGHPETDTTDTGCA